jgi:hypothetical protein
MTVRAIDPVTGDIVTNGIQFISEREEIVQTVKTRLALFLGEYFRDITDGTPWYESILGKNTNTDVADAILRQRIASTKGVIRLISYSSSFDPVTRKLNVSAGILTQFGMDTVVLDG